MSGRVGKPRQLRCIAAVVAVGIAVFGTAFGADSDCGTSREGGGADYRNPKDSGHLYIVEKGHFNSDVENLLRGQSGADLMSDIDYVLRRFPNHHRALNSMSRYYYQSDGAWKRKGRKTPECYFQLAVESHQDDGMVWLLYGIHLHRAGRHDEAVKKYQTAIEINPESAEVHYNLGLLFVDMDRVEQAHEHAIKAYQLGYPLPGLRDRLRREGVWSEDDDRALLGQTSPAAGQD